MRAARVAILTPWGERLGGAEEMLWTALRNCDRKRLHPAVIFLGEGSFVADVAALGIDVEVVLPGRLRQPLKTARAIAAVSAALRGQRPDVVLNWSAKAQLYGSPAALLAGLASRVVWWQHQIPEGHWLDRLATLLPARAIGCSSSAGRDAQACLAPRRRSFVVNPGLDFEALPVRGAGPSRESLGIAPAREVVGIVGRLQPWKGQDRFLLALAQLRDAGRDVHGLVVGGDAWDLSPQYAAGLESLIERLGLARFVTMTGQVDDPAPYFRAMDVAVNASEAEPFGIVLLEAMAAGVPVVAVGRGGPLDIVEPGVTGVLCDDGQPASLARAIDSLLGDARRRASMGEEARRRCRERFDATRMADALAARLTEVAYG